MQLVLRVAVQDDRPLMRKLLECFHVKDEFIDSFFENVLPTSHCIIGEYYRRPVAALYLIPASVYNKKAFYIYGAAVLPTHRERGIMSRMMKKLFEWCEANDCIAFTKIGNRDTIRMSIHNGMELGLFYRFDRCTEGKHTPEGTHLFIKDISDDDYIYYRQHFHGEGAIIRWSEPFMKFGLKLFREGGGRVVRITVGYVCLFALMNNLYKSVVLSEALGDKHNVDFVLPFLVQRYKAHVAVSFSPCMLKEGRRFAGFLLRGMMSNPQTTTYNYYRNLI